MEDILKKVIAGLLFLLCWYYLIPYLRKKKANLVSRVENDLKKRGLSKHYNFTHKIVKIFLYLVLILLLLPFILLFLVVIL